jgi:hypothetical protein
MAREMSDFEKVLQKVLDDPTYPNRLRTHPKEALAELKIEATPAKLAALDSAHQPLRHAHREFGGRLHDDIG